MAIEIKDFANHETPQKRGAKSKRIIITIAIILLVSISSASIVYAVTTNNKILTVQTELEESKQETTQYKNKIQELNNSIDNKEQENNEKEQQIQEITKQNTAESNKTKELEKQIEELKQENETVKKERDDAVIAQKEAEKEAKEAYVKSMEINPTVTREHTNIDGYEWGYLLYKYRPKAKNQKLIVYLHGSSAVGNDLSILENYWSLSRLISKQIQTPDCIVLMPQSPESPWNTEELKKLIDQVIETTKADKQHISITGFSLGGFGTWDMLNAYPTFFEAAAPIAGSATKTDHLHECTARVMALSGTADIYEGATGIEIIKSNPNAIATHIWIEGADHSGMCNMYEDPTHNPVPFLLGETSAN